MNAMIKSGEQRHDIVVFDICRRGLSFGSTEKYKKGDKLSFELHINDINDGSESVVISVQAKVLNDFGKKDDGLYHYGVKFFFLSSRYATACIEKHIIFPNSEKPGTVLDKSAAQMSYLRKHLK